MTDPQQPDPGPVFVASIHPVRSYELWKQQVDRAAPLLARLGVARQWIYRGADDPHEVMSVLQLPSVAHAEELLKSLQRDVPEMMEHSGLEIYPTFFVGAQIEVREFPAVQAE